MQKLVHMAFGAALMIAAPVCAQPVSPASFPQGEQSSDGKATTTAQEQQGARASADAASPNVADNTIPNGGVTANPPGAGASNSATLAEHGEVGTSANSNAGAAATVNR